MGNFQYFGLFLDEETKKGLLDVFLTFSNPINRYGCHSIKHCGVHKIDTEYAMKLFLIGEERLKELWNDPSLKDCTWEEIINNEYLKIKLD